MEHTICDPPDPAVLQRRAADFSLAEASGRYLDLLLGGKQHAA
jgi:hypothetical protein